MCAPCRFSPHDGSTGRFFHVENEALRRICWGSILTAQTPQTQHCAPIRWLWLIFAQNQASDSAQCRRAEPNRAVRTALFSVRHSAQNLPTPNLHFSPIKPTFSHRFFAPRKNDDPPKIGQNRAFSPLCLYHVHTSP